MQNLPIIDVQKSTWEQLIADFGHGRAGPRYIYKRDCHISAFPGHKVLRGPNPAGGFTDSGFLANEAGAIVGGVDAISA
jgi:hypothetical protein